MIYIVLISQQPKTSSKWQLCLRCFSLLEIWSAREAKEATYSSHPSHHNVASPGVDQHKNHWEEVIAIGTSTFMALYQF